MHIPIAQYALRHISLMGLLAAPTRQYWVFLSETGKPPHRLLTHNHPKSDGKEFGSASIGKACN
jgi:hypothetical protein